VSIEPARTVRARRLHDAVDIPANVMSSLISPAKLAGVLAVLLGGAVSVPGVLARPLPHLQARRQARHDPATPDPRHRAAQPVRADVRGHEAIVGGAPARTGAFASVAEIIDFRGLFAVQCTGTVVAPRLILTAGHCAENIKTGVVNAASGYRVLTGGVEGPGVERQILTVSGVIVYEGFLSRVDDGDAALLVLSTPTAAPAVRLAGADTGQVHAGTSAAMAGWGSTHYEQRLPTEGLRWADTVVQADRWCRRNAPPFFAASEICTIDPPRYATGACSGDSGGPLLAPEGAAGAFAQIGIAVHVYGRCSTRLPSVFTRVEPIAPWVQTWIDAYERPPSPSSPPSPPTS